MNTKQFFGAIAFAALGITTSAQAENYEGVLTVRTDRLRSDLAVDAREAARHPVAGEAFFPEAPLGNARSPAGFAGTQEPLTHRTAQQPRSPPAAGLLTPTVDTVLPFDAQHWCCRSTRCLD